MSPGHPETMETHCDNLAFEADNSMAGNCNREVQIDCQNLDLNSYLSVEEQQSTFSSSTGSSTSPDFSNKLSIIIEPPEKDQFSIYPLTNSAMKNCLGQPKIIVHNSKKHRNDQISCFFANQARHITLIIGTLCLMMILSNILILNVTIVCMTSPRQHLFSEEFDHWLKIDSLVNKNRTIQQDTLEPEFSYSHMEKTSFFAMMAGGAVFAVPFAVYLVKQLGGRKAFVLAGMLSAISTAFNPMAADFGVAWFIISRVGQGMPLAFSLPIIGSMTAGWSTIKYSGVFVCIATSFVQLAPVFTMPIAGIVCTSSLGWPMVYYIHAAATIIFFTLWGIFYRDTPRAHPCVSKQELAVITTGKPPQPSNQNVPIGAIFASPAVWAIWLAAFANFAGMQLFVIFMPMYMNKVLDMPIKTASILAALPPLAQFFVKLFAAILSDHFTIFSKTSETSKLRLFNTISSLGGGVLLIILACIPTTEQFWSLLFLILSSSMLGFNTSGVFRSTSLVAKQHAYFVTGVIQFFYCFVLLAMPFAIEELTVMRPTKDWSMVFITIAFLLTFTNIFFCVFGKGKAAPWTKLSIVASEITC